MELYREYFPTKAYKFAKMKMGTLLGAELDRLDGVAKSLGREYAVGPDNLASQMPMIREFTAKYHEVYAQYLDAVLVQHDKPVQCRPACGNCCHHYPMSVEPFELLSLYSELRKSDDLLSIMEACQLRASRFNKIYETRLSTAKSDDDAEDLALHDYFADWRPCPFSNEVGDCGIYRFRPVSCRMYFSETDPRYCTPEFLQTEKNDSYIVYLPDPIEETIYAVSEHYAGLDLPESFFGGLLAANAYEGLLADAG